MAPPVTEPHAVVSAPEQPPEPRPASSVAVAGGLGGGAVLVYVVDRLLANDGQIAANMLSRLSPLLGPVWASYPVLILLVGAIAYGIAIARASQAARAKEAKAAAAQSEALRGEVVGVVTGLAGLRSEVHELRGALQDHADRTDQRLRGQEEGLRAVQAEVSGVARRVDVLERPPVVPARRRR